MRREKYRLALVCQLSLAIGVSPAPFSDHMTLWSLWSRDEPSFCALPKISKPQNDVHNKMIFVLCH